MGIKPSAIVLNRYLRTGIHALEPHLYLACLRVLLDIAEALLDYAKDGELDKGVRGHISPGAKRALNPCLLAQPVHTLPNGRYQTKLIQGKEVSGRKSAPAHPAHAPSGW